MAEATSTSQAEYSAALSPLLPRHVFQPRPQRLVFGAIHALIVTACAWGVMVVDTWPLQLLLGVLLGHSLAIISFLGHEILHGSVVKGRTLVRLLGGLCFSYWGLLPWVWVRWHNQIHHKHTNDPFVDPDCWGKELTYRVSRVARFLEWFSPGSGRPTSALYLPAFFSVKVLVMIAVFPGFIKSRWERIQALGYFLVSVAWAGACAAALSRGLSVRLLARNIAIIATVLAVVGLAQKATFNDKLLWFWTPEHYAWNGFGPFVNRNHFAGWMLLALCLTLGLARGYVSRAGLTVAPTWRDRRRAHDCSG